MAKAFVSKVGKDGERVHEMVDVPERDPVEVAAAEEAVAEAMARERAQAEARGRLAEWQLSQSVSVDDLAAVVEDLLVVLGIQ